MKKLMGMAEPLGADCTRYLQRSRSGFKTHALPLPALTLTPFTPSKTNKRSISNTLERQSSEKFPQGKPERLRSTNQTNASKLSLRSRREEGEPQEGLAQHVDNIMNEMIAARSPELSGNSAIKRSISTKKFRNVRVMTDGDEPSSGCGLRTSLLIKQILSFMLKHSQENQQHKKALREDPEIYNQDLSRFSPIMLVKKSEEMLGLSPVHQFKRHQEHYHKPLDSETYIRQLRTSKL